MTTTTKQLQLLFTNVDERVFSGEISEQIDHVHYLDGNIWYLAPKEAASIDACENCRCYLYQGNLEEIPTLRRPDGRLQGPSSGCVVQVSRSREADGVLYSGSIGVGFDSTSLQMKRFVEKVWRSLKVVSSMGVLRPDGIVDNHYLVGLDAKKRSASNELQLRDRSVEIYYNSK